MTAYTSRTIDVGGITAAYDINDAGQIVGGYFHAYVIYSLADGTYTLINNPSGVNGTDGYGIDDAGQIVGDYADGTLNHAFFYAGGSSYTTLNGRFAWDINDSGQIVGDYGTSGTSAFIYSNGIYTNISYPQSSLTSAQGINDNGEVVGYYQDGAGYHAFTYLNGNYSPLPDASTEFANAAPGETFATGVNDSGWIVGYFYDAQGAHTVFWTSTTTSN
jgi:probable HAF family extracellular repeat protein